MAWARLDDNRHDHPKILELGDDLHALAAVGLLDHAITWASRHRRSSNPGLVPWSFWRTRAGRNCKRLTDMLLQAGLVDADPGNLGLWLHDFDTYQAKRDPAEASASGRKGAEKRYGRSYSHSSSDSNSYEIATSYSHDSATDLAIANDGSRAAARAFPTRPDPTRPSSASLDGPPAVTGRASAKDHHEPKTLDPQWVSALTAAVRNLRPAWATPLIKAAIRLASEQAGPDRVSRALLAVAHDQTTEVPQRVLSPGYWWEESDTRYLRALERIDHDDAVLFPGLAKLKEGIPA